MKDIKLHGQLARSGSQRQAISYPSEGKQEDESAEQALDDGICLIEAHNVLTQQPQRRTDLALMPESPS